MENRRKGVYNIRLVARLIGTVLCTDRVAVLAELGRNYRYYEYRTAVRVPWSYQQATPAVETAGWQIAVGGVYKVSPGGPVTLNYLCYLFLTFWHR